MFVHLLLQYVKRAVLMTMEQLSADRYRVNVDCPREWEWEVQMDMIMIILQPQRRLHFLKIYHVHKLLIVNIAMIIDYLIPYEFPCKTLMGILLLFVNNVVLNTFFHMINHHVQVDVRQIITLLVIMFNHGYFRMLGNVINVKLAVQHVLMLMIVLLVILLSIMLR